jgi:hypothetical protein
MIKYVITVVSKEVMPAMTADSSAGEEIDITEAMQITGKSRETLMRWKRQGKLTTRTEDRTYAQRQRRVLFRKDEIERMAGQQEG